MAEEVAKLWAAVLSSARLSASTAYLMGSQGQVEGCGHQLEEVRQQHDGKVPLDVVCQRGEWGDGHHRLRLIIMLVKFWQHQQGLDRLFSEGELQGKRPPVIGHSIHSCVPAELQFGRGGVARQDYATAERVRDRQWLRLLRCWLGSRRRCWAGLGGRAGRRRWRGCVDVDLI
eukprot:scaffold375831_cov38-Prasinocladus_malaysianus.AAC.1